MTKWIGARRRIGYGTDSRGWLLSDRVAPPRDVSHLVDRYLYLLKAQGHETRAQVDDFCITPEAQQFAENLLNPYHAMSSTPSVGIHPGAFFGESKTWPLEHFKTLIHRLVDSGVAQVFILGGPDEIELTGQLNAMSGGRAVNLAGKDTLETPARPAVSSGRVHLRRYGSAACGRTRKNPDDCAVRTHGLSSNRPERASEQGHPQGSRLQPVFRENVSSRPSRLHETDYARGGGE